MLDRKAPAWLGASREGENIPFFGFDYPSPPVWQTHYCTLGHEWQGHQHYRGKLPMGRYLSNPNWEAKGRAISCAAAFQVLSCGKAYLKHRLKSQHKETEKESDEWRMLKTNRRCQAAALDFICWMQLCCPEQLVLSFKRFCIVVVKPCSPAASGPATWSIFRSRDSYHQLWGFGLHVCLLCMAEALSIIINRYVRCFSLINKETLACVAPNFKTFLKVGCLRSDPKSFFRHVNKKGYSVQRWQVAVLGILDTQHS